MFKDLLARFKRVFTVADWKKEAQAAMVKKEFVVEALTELHRVEKEESGMMIERDRQRSPSYQHGPFAPTTNNAHRTQPKSFAESSLAELMNAVRQQQTSN